MIDCEGITAFASVTIKFRARTLIVNVELKSEVETVTGSPCEPFDVPETSTSISPGKVIPLTL